MVSDKPGRTLEIFLRGLRGEDINVVKFADEYKVSSKKHKQNNKRSQSLSRWPQRACWKHGAAVFALRKALNNLPVADVTEQIITQMTQTKTNTEFIEKMDSYLKNYKN